jgi:hypothetical protein
MVFNATFNNFIGGENRRKSQICRKSLTNFIICTSENVDICTSENVDICTSENVDICTSENVDICTSENVDICTSENVDPNLLGMLTG